MNTSSKKLSIIWPCLAMLSTVFGLSACDDRAVDGRANKGGNYILTSPTPSASGLPSPTVTPTPSPTVTPSTTVQPKVLIGQKLLAPFPVREEGSEIAPLHSGEDLFSTRWKLLSEATKSVKIQTLIFSGDEAGWTFAEKLVDLHKKGIKVELIVDAASNPMLKDLLLYTYLNSNGVIVYGYESSILSFFSDIRGSSKIVDVIDMYNPVQHEKIFLVDAEIPERATAIIGGSNIQNGYFFLSNGDNRLIIDQDVVVRGQIIKDLQTVFDANALRIKNIPASTGVTDTAGLWKTLELLKNTTGFDLKLPIPKPKQDAVVLQKISQLKLKAVDLDWQPTVNTKVVYSQPLLQKSSISQAYLEAIAKATSSIEICNAYLLLDDQVTEALRKAALDRGVVVRILTNSSESSDYKFIPLAARELYAKLIKGIPSNLIQIFEWKGKLPHASETVFIHAKYALFDKETAFIGSFNLDPRSQFLNSEILIQTNSQHLADFLDKEFENSLLPDRVTLMTEAEISKTTKAYNYMEVLQRMLGTTFISFL